MHTKITVSNHIKKQSTVNAFKYLYLNPRKTMHTKITISNHITKQSTVNEVKRVEITG